MSNSKSRRPPASAPVTAPRDSLLLGLASLGVVLSLYLLLVQQQSGALPGCAPGGGCDLVQQSRWSRLFGLPVAAWGIGYYALLAGLAGWRGLQRRFEALAVLAPLGLAVSLYLTFVTWRELRVTCPYCLVSLVLVAALTARAVWRVARPYRLWLGALAGLAGVVLVAGLHQAFGGYEKAFSGPESRYLSALADHLRDSDARFYGAYWCPHCQHQKAMFGRAADRLPYVECSPHGGPGSPVATDCLNANVTSYPTWNIRGKTYARMLTVPEAAALSGFDAPAADGADAAAP